MSPELEFCVGLIALRNGATRRIAVRIEISKTPEHLPPDGPHVCLGQAQGIYANEWPGRDVAVGVTAAPKSNRVAFDVSAYPRIVVPEVVVMFRVAKSTLSTGG